MKYCLVFFMTVVYVCHVSAMEPCLRLPVTLAKSGSVRTTSSMDELVSKDSTLSLQAQFINPLARNREPEVISGKLFYKFDFYNITSGDSLSYNIFAYYSSGNVDKTSDKHNRECPTGVLGLGWYQPLEYVSVLHNGTKTVSDDEWYYVNQYGQSHQINIKVPCQEDLTENMEVGGGIVAQMLNHLVSYRYVNGKIIGWKIISPDGSKKYFGDWSQDGLLESENNACKVTLSSGDAVGLVSAHAQYYYDRWYLKRYEHSDKIHCLDFTYHNREGSVHPLHTTPPTYSYVDAQSEVVACDGVVYHLTQEIYLKEIKNNYNEVVSFYYAPKAPYEYADPSPAPLDYYETRYLTGIEIKNNDNIKIKYSFDSNVPSSAVENQNYFKRELSGISIFDESETKACPDYKFTYAPVGYLHIIDNPLGKRTYIQYSTKSNIYNIFNDNNISDVGNISDLKDKDNVSLPPMLDSKSKIIVGDGFLVVSNYSNGIWTPNYYSLIDSGYRPIDPANTPELPTSYGLKSFLYSNDDKLVYYYYSNPTYTSSTPYTISMFWFNGNTNKFQHEFTQAGFPEGTKLLCSGTNLIIQTPNSDRKTKTVNYYRVIDGVWNLNTYYKQVTDEKIDAEYSLNGNLMAVNKGSDLIFGNIKYDGSTFIWEQRLLSQIMASAPYKVEQVNLFKNKIAFVAVFSDFNPPAPGEKIFYTAYWNGAAYSILHATHHYDIDENSVMAWGDKVFCSPEYVAYYDRSLNKIKISSWNPGDLRTLTITVPFSEYLNGFYVKNWLYLTRLSPNLNGALEIWGVDLNQTPNLEQTVRIVKLSETNAIPSAIMNAKNKDKFMIANNRWFLNVSAPISTGFSENASDLSKQKWENVDDWNGDGICDLIRFSESLGFIVNFGLPAGGFDGTIHQISTSTVNPEWATVFDFNNDGLKDLVRYNEYDADPWTFLINDGNEIAIPARFETSSGDWVIGYADWNRDKIIDLVEFNQSSGYRWIEGIAQGGWGTSHSISPSTVWGDSTWLDDFNGDGWYDLVRYKRTEANPWTFFINDKKGGAISSLYTTGKEMPCPYPCVFDWNYYSWIQFGDWDNDGVLDLVQYSPIYHLLRMVKGLASGGWSTEEYLLSDSDVAMDQLYDRFWVKDFNGDGWVDVLRYVEGLDGNRWTFFYNNHENGTYVNPMDTRTTAGINTSLNYDLNGYTIKEVQWQDFVDWNADGILDLIQWRSEDIRVVFGTVADGWNGGVITLSTANAYDTYLPERKLHALVDFDGDGLTDFLFRSANGTLFTILNAGDMKLKLASIAHNEINPFDNYSFASVHEISVGNFTNGAGSNLTDITRYHYFDEDLSTVRNEFKGIGPYFTLNNLTCQVMNIKQQTLYNNGTYLISFRYGDNLSPVGFVAGKHNASNDRYYMDNYEYRLMSYYANCVVAGEKNVFYEKYYPGGRNDLSENYVLVREKEVETIKDKISEVVKTVYYPGSEMDLLWKRTEVKPDNSKYLTSYSYAFQNPNSDDELRVLNILAPVSSYLRNVDEDGENDYDPGEFVLEHTGTEWRETADGYWAKAWDWKKYFKTPKDIAPAYITRKNIVWDEAGNVVEENTGKENPLNGNLVDSRKHCKLYYPDGELVFAEVKNASLDEVVIGFQNGLSGWMPISSGGMTGNFQFQNDGLFRSGLVGGSVSSVVKPSMLSEIMVEFDACCRYLTEGNVVINGLLFNIPTDSNILGKMQHVSKKIKLNSNQVNITMSPGIYIENFMMYPDSAEVKLIYYNKTTKKVNKTVVSGNIKSMVAFDQGNQLLGETDKKGNIFSTNRLYYPADLSLEAPNYNVIEKVSFNNGNLIPFWSFEEKGYNSDATNLPFWKPLSSDPEGLILPNISVSAEACMYGEHSLEIQPSNNGQGVYIDFQCNKVHPQYSSIIGNTVTLSYWVYVFETAATIQTTLENNLDVNFGKTIIEPDEWRYVSITFTNVSPTSIGTADGARIRIVIRETDNLAKYYIDGVVLEIGNKSTHPVVTTAFVSPLDKLLRVHERRYGTDGSPINEGDSIIIQEYNYNANNELVEKSLPVCFSLKEMFGYPDYSSKHLLLSKWLNPNTLEWRLGQSYGGLGADAYFRYEYLGDGSGRLSESSLPGPGNSTHTGCLDKEYYYGTIKSIRSGNVFSPVSETGNEGVFDWKCTKKPVAPSLYVFEHSYLNWQGKEILKYNTKNSPGITVSGGNSNLMTISYKEYDPAGNVTLEYAPANFNVAGAVSNQISASKPPVSEYEYDIDGKIMKMVSGDYGNINRLQNGAIIREYQSIEYRYDRTGKIRFTRDPKHASSSEKDFIVNLYDSKERLTKMVDISAQFAGDFNDEARQNDMKWPAPNDVDKYRLLQENIYDDLGRLQRAVCHSQNTKLPVDAAYYYDGDNNIICIEENIPNFRKNIHRYTYYTNGLVKTYEFMDKGHPEHFVREMNYDNMGRLSIVGTKDLTGGQNREEINFSYNDPRALLTQAITPAYTQSNGYDVQGRLDAIAVKRINTTLFKEELVYDNTNFKHTSYPASLTPQYNGNIAGIRYTGVDPNYSEQFAYTYDPISRLQAVNYKRETDGDGYPNGRFGSTYAYGSDGEIISISRNELKTDLSIRIRNGDYQYFEETHRLKNVVGDLRGVDEFGDAENFKYDPNGNMIEDGSKKMKVEYDWRNLPIRFKFYSDGSMTQLKYVVQMVYDASGNRVAKFNFNLN